MKTTKDYQDLYLKCDVLLLVDAFEKFRKNSLKNYGSCASHYLSAPTLCWDAMLNMTKIKLELISDPGVYHGTIIRTGITCKKIPCYMRNSACRWFIVKKAKIFRSYV